MLHMDWKQLCKLHIIMRKGETVLVNTFTELTTIVHSEVLQMFVQAIRDSGDTYSAFLFPRDSDRIVLLLKQYYYLLLRADIEIKMM